MTWLGHIRLCILWVRITHSWVESWQSITNVFSQNQPLTHKHTVRRRRTIHLWMWRCIQDKEECPAAWWPPTFLRFMFCFLLQTPACTRPETILTGGNNHKKLQKITKQCFKTRVNISHFAVTRFYVKFFKFSKSFPSNSILWYLGNFWFQYELL